MGLRSFWTFSLLAPLVLLFHHKFVAQAEISSQRANDRLRVVPLAPRVRPETTDVNDSIKIDTNGTKVFNANETDPGDGFNGRSGEAPAGTTNYPETLDEKYGSFHQGRSVAKYYSRNKAKRSVAAAYGDSVDRSSSGGAQTRDRFVEAVHGVSTSRAEYRRSGDEARGSNPRPNEPYLDTSTFALSGDSAHNQAMVHWSGHNSSVSSSLTPNTPHPTPHTHLSHLVLSLKYIIFGRF